MYLKLSPDSVNRAIPIQLLATHTLSPTPHHFLPRLGLEDNLSSSPDARTVYIGIQVVMRTLQRNILTSPHATTALIVKISRPSISIQPNAIRLASMSLKTPWK